ncbi:peptidase [Streptomyces sp. NPDC007910]|uniref:peptidase n=1 Tax=Streptomyces sp. NPDC007910 TaxID=3364790 RepID=UPI0036EC0ED7
MKIRRILATAVAAAVTTPVVFLSAAPAFADTKPSPAATQKPAQNEDDKPPTHQELVEAVAKAQAKLDALEAERKQVLKDLKDDTIDPALKAEFLAAEEAVKVAEEARKTADQKVVTAQAAFDKLTETSTEEERKLAEKDLADAKKAAEDAVTAKTAADLRLEKARTAYDDARVALARKAELLRRDIVLAEEELAQAEQDLEDFEELSECVEDDAVRIDLSGPETITAGQPAVFSMRVTNTSDRALDLVDVYANASRLILPGEDVDEDTDFTKWSIPVEWSSADVLEWTPVSDEFESIEVGKLAKGAHYDVKLRLTAAADSPAGQGMAFAYAEYENNDGTCGMALDGAHAGFDILAKGDKPKPTPTPSPSTSTPAPAPSTGNTGNTNTTQQGGSSSTPVNNGTLAATGANDVLPQLGLAAAGAVALGAGAVFVARRRKAGTQA